MKHLKSFENIFDIFKPKIKIDNFYSYKDKSSKLYGVVKCTDIITKNNRQYAEVFGYNITASKFGNRIGQKFSYYWSDDYTLVPCELLKPATKKEIELYNYYDTINSQDKFNL